MAKYPQVGLTKSYYHEALILGRPCETVIRYGYVKTFSYGKKGKTFTTHTRPPNAGGDVSYAFWLGEEGYLISLS